MPTSEEGRNGGPIFAATADTAAEERQQNRTGSVRGEHSIAEEGTDALTSISLAASSAPVPVVTEGQCTGQQQSEGQSAKRHKASAEGEPRSGIGQNAVAVGPVATEFGPIVGAEGECAVCQQGGTEKLPLHWVVRLIGLICDLNHPSALL